MLFWSRVGFFKSNLIDISYLQICMLDKQRASKSVEDFQA